MPPKTVRSWSSIQLIRMIATGDTTRHALDRLQVHASLIRGPGGSEQAAQAYVSYVRRHRGDPRRHRPRSRERKDETIELDLGVAGACTRMRRREIANLERASRLESVNSSGSAVYRSSLSEGLSNGRSADVSYRSSAKATEMAWLALG